jgi:hypothetical protein
VWAVALAATALGARAAVAGHRDAHVIVLDGSAYATNVDIDQLVHIRKGRTGEFFWFSRGGRAYVVDDPQVLAVGREILRPVRALSAEQEELSARLKPFEKREDELDREEERLDERADALDERDDRASRDERERLDALQRDLDAKQDALRTDLRDLEAEERRLDDRERAIEAVADEQLARLVEGALRRGLARPAR